MVPLAKEPLTILRCHDGRILERGCSKDRYLHHEPSTRSQDSVEFAHSCSIVIDVLEDVAAVGRIEHAIENSGAGEVHSDLDAATSLQIGSDMLDVRPDEEPSQSRLWCEMEEAQRLGAIEYRQPVTQE